MNRRLKKSVVYGGYIFGLILLIGMIFVVESMVPKKEMSDQDYSYVSKTIFDDVVPVIKVEEKIMKPFSANDVEKIKIYYDHHAEETTQQEGIIYYENTYMQSNGISYGKDSLFDVISILPGTVEDVRDDELLGKIVTIKHSDNISSIYQCLSKTAVSKGDSVISGQIVGQSGNCNLEKEKSNVVYFELILNGQTVNPEEYYGKTLKDIKG